ncbi:Zn-dependent alcohol dehydrogenase [Paracoccus sp. DMF-8]|uniref:Zn-dependent alcohol dehydrogenase n=1 Tax=Paracoccus sp. DMF-8 TaxID=3019445 RepID=UPI0023E7EF8F|nr:Zn-dependent alcohol dehydrogenase [Paracoccus sp. DMF-8]MDF3604912.1 Zn-dependent alcohol dehydrogenase [Paracoccus sp. DMF-8]
MNSPTDMNRMAGAATIPVNRRFRAAVLHGVNQPLRTQTVEVTALAARDVLVRVRAAGLCHTDLEVIEGGLRQPMPIVLGHEAAGVVEAVGPMAQGVKVGDHVILSWNPHCGHCFYCDQSLPILCETYLANTPRAQGFDGQSKARLVGGGDLHQLMYLGAFGEYCVVQDQQAVPIPPQMPFDQAALIGCGVMTGVGAVLNVAQVRPGQSVMVVGCGAVGLAALQGARLGGADTIIAVDLQDGRLTAARAMGATHLVNPGTQDATDVARSLTSGRGVDCVLESAGNERAFRLTVEAVRPGGQVVWLGKTDVDREIAFRWGSLMQEKRIRRSSYGDARPKRDFPFLCRAALDGRLDLSGLISQRITLDQINQGSAALKAGETIRSVILFDD